MYLFSSIDELAVKQFKFAVMRRLYMMVTRG